MHVLIKQYIVMVKCELTALNRNSETSSKCVQISLEIGEMHVPALERHDLYIDDGLIDDLEG